MSENSEDLTRWNGTPAPMPERVWLYPFFENSGNDGKTRKRRWAISIDGPHSQAWRLFVRADSKEESNK